jgi:Holliday junction DNA helicase RuvB
VHKRELDETLVEEALTALGYDGAGLQESDRALLRIIIEKFNGGPVGLSTLAAAMAEEVATIEEVYEPYLLRSGLIERTPRGRTVTELGYTHLGLTPPPNTVQGVLC